MRCLSVSQVFDSYILEKMSSDNVNKINKRFYVIVSLNKYSNPQVSEF